MYRIYSVFFSGGVLLHCRGYSQYFLGEGVSVLLHCGDTVSFFLVRGWFLLHRKEYSHYFLGRCLTPPQGIQSVFSWWGRWYLTPLQGIQSVFSWWRSYSTRDDTVSIFLVREGVLLHCRDTVSNFFAREGVSYSTARDTVRIFFAREWVSSSTARDTVSIFFFFFGQGGCVLFHSRKYSQYFLSGRSYSTRGDTVSIFLVREGVLLHCRDTVSIFFAREGVSYSTARDTVRIFFAREWVSSSTARDTVSIFFFFFFGQGGCVLFHSRKYSQYFLSGRSYSTVEDTVSILLARSLTPLQGIQYVLGRGALTYLQGLAVVFFVPYQQNDVLFII